MPCLKNKQSEESWKMTEFSLKLIITYDWTIRRTFCNLQPLQKTLTALYSLMIQQHFPCQHCSCQCFRVERFCIMSVQGKQRKSYSIWCLGLWSLGLGSAMQPPLYSKAPAQTIYSTSTRYMQQERFNWHNLQHGCLPIPWGYLTNEAEFLSFIWIFFSLSIGRYRIMCNFRLCWIRMVKAREDNALSCSFAATSESKR